MKWITVDEISNYEFCPADTEILEKIKYLLKPTVIGGKNVKSKLIFWGVVLLFILIAGGIIPFCQALGAFSQGFWAAFPIYAEMAVDDYFSSAYFWTGVIMLIASAFGFWFGKKGGKILYSIISVVIFIISLISIGLNIIN